MRFGGRIAIILGILTTVIGGWIKVMLNKAFFWAIVGNAVIGVGQFF